MAGGSKMRNGKKRRSNAQLRGNNKKQRKSFFEKEKKNTNLDKEFEKCPKNNVTEENVEDEEHVGSSEEEDADVLVKTPLEELVSTFNVVEPGGTSDEDSSESESNTQDYETEEHTTEAHEDSLVSDDDEEEEEEEGLQNYESTNRDGRIEEDLLKDHFEKEFEEKIMTQILAKNGRITKETHFSHLGVVKVSCCLPQLIDYWDNKNKPAGGWDPKLDIEPELFSILSSYRDLLLCQRHRYNEMQLIASVCLHVVNHVLKSRARILRHNAKLKRMPRDGDREYRDQGLTRPKVLILIPFRSCATKYVQSICNILSEEDGTSVMNKKRFYDEYSSKDEEADKKILSMKPVDHKQLFAGNTDDNFRFGVALKKKCIRLYAPFYSSDILLASPLGLRIAINNDSDFLSSIEILILDQTEVMLMQSWDHILHITQHLHLQPKESHGVDFSRVRRWALESNWAKCYRQTVSMSSILCSEIVAYFNRFCFNYSGLLSSQMDSSGDILRVAVQLPQTFQRFQVNSPQEDADERFKFFTETVLPQYKSALMKGTLIFIPSYFDFVRLRNHFRKEDISFAQICEYTEIGKTAEARDKFFHRHRKFLLYTERIHFYKRYVLKGVRHIIFYQLPLIPRYYSELCNFVQLKGRTKAGEELEESTCSVLISRYDSYRLAAVVGQNKASKILSNSNNVHLLVSGDI